MRLAWKETASCSPSRSRAWRLSMAWEKDTVGSAAEAGSRAAEVANNDASSREESIGRTSAWIRGEGAFLSSAVARRQRCVVAGAPLLSAALQGRTDGAPAIGIRHQQE